MAEEGIELVYGGGATGLMGVLANAVLARGGNVCGVIPTFLSTKKLAHTGLTRRIVTRSMHERKMTMSQLADAFAVLPGGFGTLDEFLEILTWKQLRLHSRPLIIANTDGWFDPLLEYFRRASALGAMSKANLKLYAVANRAEEVIDILLRFKQQRRA